MAAGARYRLWIAGGLAAIALILVAIAAVLPFMDNPPGGVAGSIATLVIVAEVFAALATVVVGRELYGKIWAKLQSMRAELSKQSTEGTIRSQCMCADNVGEGAMTKPVDIKAALAGRPALSGRTAHTSDADAEAAFATLAPFKNGAIFAGSFDGVSPWERHPNGDELVHILDGATTLTVIIDDEPRVFEMTGGMLVVVPQGCWHRFKSPRRSDGSDDDSAAHRAHDHG